MNNCWRWALENLRWSLVSRWRKCPPSPSLSTELLKQKLWLCSGTNEISIRVFCETRRTEFVLASARNISKSIKAKKMHLFVFPVVFLIFQNSHFAHFPSSACHFRPMSASVIVSLDDFYFKSSQQRTTFSVGRHDGIRPEANFFTTYSYRRICLVSVALQAIVESTSEQEVQNK